MVTAFRRFGLLLLGCFMLGCGPVEQPRTPTPAGETQSGETDAMPSDEDTFPGESGANRVKSPAGAIAGSATDQPDASEPNGNDANSLDRDGGGDSDKTAVGKLPGPLPSPEQWQSWSEVLKGGTPETRSAAADAIVECLEPFDSAAVIGLLNHESDDVRRCVAFYLLGRFDPNDSSAVEAMKAALSDDDATVRHIALSAIKRLPVTLLVSAIPKLEPMLNPKREDAANRAAIVRLLAGLGRQGNEALPRLFEVLREDPDASVRSAAAVAIPRIAEPAQAATELQKALAAESEPRVQTVLVVRLAKFGPSAAEAVDTLAALLDSEDHELQRKVIDALIAIGQPAVPQLIGHLGATNVQIRRLAVFALGSLGEEATDAIEPLKARQTDEDEVVRQLTEIALRRIQAEN